MVQHTDASLSQFADDGHTELEKCVATFTSGVAIGVCREGLEDM
jgi:hypothetical protein